MIAHLYRTLLLHLLPLADRLTLDAARRAAETELRMAMEAGR